MRKFRILAIATLAVVGMCRAQSGPAPQAHEQKSAAADAQVHPTWTDPSTGLMWAGRDNGSDVTWRQAADYCRKLTLGGHHDWRLPEIDELAGIYDQTQNVNDWHIKGGIQLSGWTWASRAGSAPGFAWEFFFSEGKRSSAPDILNDGGRALCVRHS